MKNSIENKIKTIFSRLNNKVAFIFTLMILFSNSGCKEGINSKKEEKSTTKKPLIVKEKWHWNNPEKQNTSAGYAQVIKVGNTIYISGVPTSEFNSEGVARLYKTLEECLNSFGATPKDVVKETLYTINIDTMKKYNEARKEFYQGDYPAASWVQISRLYEPEAKLEVDLVAIITDTN